MVLTKASLSSSTQYSQLSSPAVLCAHFDTPEQKPPGGQAVLRTKTSAVRHLKETAKSNQSIQRCRRIRRRRLRASAHGQFDAAKYTSFRRNGFRKAGIHFCGCKVLSVSLQEAADSSECIDSLQAHKSFFVYNDTLFGELPTKSTCCTSHS